jgi:hypothetical protein
MENIINMTLLSDKRPWQELDSFYDARVVICLGNGRIARDAYETMTGEGFANTVLFFDAEEFCKTVLEKKHDLIIVDLKVASGGIGGYDLIEKIRENDADVQIITVSNRYGEIRKKLDLVVHRHFKYPFLVENLIKASKKALGDKANYEIGMQFFNALFGMQMCTHRDLHQRTFDHVIRTTKVYGKFLLFLNRKEYIDLNSWVFKNCLMASLVHDIGKLLVMHGVLYKDGKLTAFEYEQVKRHPWHSITALLGGYDIDFFAKENLPLQSVSGYNDKNLGVQVRNWIFKIFNNDMTALDDVEGYFNELSAKPFIHSLNFDLLYIVFRHHDGVNESYIPAHELELFGKILGRVMLPTLSSESPLDVVTNALTVCDMYDALLDTTRDYRRGSFCIFFALLVLHNEMKRGTFFPFLADEFIRYVIENEPIAQGQPFADCDNAECALAAVQNINALFMVSRDQETEFNDFLIARREDIERIAPKGITDELRAIHQDWMDYFDIQRNERVNHFMGELRSARLIDKDIDSFSLEEIKTFDMLFRCYYSYSSSYKRKKLVEYLVNTVICSELSDGAMSNIADLVSRGEAKTRHELERLLIEKGYERNDLFAVFRKYDEDTLIIELNDFLRRQGL